MTAEAIPPRMPRRRDPALVPRIVSALVLGPISIFLLWRGETAFTAYVAAFAAAMAWEWLRMAQPDAPTRSYAIASVSAAGAILFAGQGDFFWAAAWPTAGAIGLTFPGDAPAARRWRGPFGLLYVAASAGLLVVLRNEEGGLLAVAFLLSVVWAADIAAYLVGTWLGGPKLWPKASPNKTWTGFVAGIAAGCGAGAAFAAATDTVMVPLVLLAGILAVASVGGDLAMSLFKRRFGVKDSGQIIPGHGGVLDRVDALMLAVIVAGVARLALPEIWP